MTDTGKLTIIVKPTHDCNLQCKYCYIEETAESGTMSLDTLKNSISKTMEYGNCLNKAIHFIWHGGEPLLMGVDFYTNVLSIQQACKSNIAVTNSIQTNGTLLDANILAFFKQTGDFHIGLSLDGPEYVHNFTRPYKNGVGSFDNVCKPLNNYKLLITSNEWV